MKDKIKKNLYEILGVDKTATKEDIKKAYHKMAQETHPDKEGGSTEAFLQVSKAYKILSDEERRRQYDETGDESESHELSPQNIVFQIFLEVISNPEFNPKLVDAFEATKQTIELRQKQIKIEIAKNSKQKTKYEEILFRIEKAPDTLKLMVEDLIKRHNEMHEQLIKNLNLGVEMLKVLKDFKYNVDTEEVMNNNNFDSTLKFISYTYKK
jgi:DnaJ-class molecular chaperone